MEIAGQLGKPYSELSTCVIKRWSTVIRKVMQLPLPVHADKIVMFSDNESQCTDNTKQITSLLFPATEEEVKNQRYSFLTRQDLWTHRVT